MILNSLELALNNLNSYLKRNNLDGKFSVRTYNSDKTTFISKGVGLGCSINKTELVYVSNGSGDFAIDLSTVPLGFIICEEDTKDGVNTSLYYRSLTVISDFLRVPVITKVSECLVTNPCDIDSMPNNYECIKDLVSAS